MHVTGDCEKEVIFLSAIKAIIPSKLYGRLKYKYGSGLYYLQKALGGRIMYDKAHTNSINFKAPNTIDEKVRWLLTYSYGRRETGRILIPKE